MNKNLLFGKAIGAALLFVMMSLANRGFAQTQVATLQHGEDFSAFYGVNAFIEAHGAAVDGDIITLSSGRFSATDITKAITIHGAGVKADTLTYCTPTYVNGDFNISIANDEMSLDVEGVFFNNSITPMGSNLHHGSFTRCNIESFGAEEMANMYDVQFVNCRIHILYVKTPADNIYGNIQLINSAVGNLITRLEPSKYVYGYNSIVGFGNSSYCIFHNCILLMGDYAHYAYNTSAYNCIIFNSLSFPTPSVAQNCLSLYNDINQIFVNYYGNGYNFFDYDYTLAENIINTFPGSDGSQVGIFGGAMPYNPRPSYIVPHNITVSGQSNVDGTLNIEIEVINEEK